MTDQSKKPEKGSDVQELVSVPVEVQIELAENRRLLAEARYELSVRRGQCWNDSTRKQRAASVNP